MLSQKLVLRSSEAEGAGHLPPLLALGRAAGSAAAGVSFCASPVYRMRKTGAALQGSRGQATNAAQRAGTEDARHGGDRVYSGHKPSYGSDR
jgi:hypothetical protein